MSGLPKQLTIRSTWDGLPIPSSEYVDLFFRWHTNTLSLEIRAPYWDDPCPEAPAGSTWGLWEFEVVEVFLVDQNGSYVELEFGPHGHYLALSLTGPRVIAEKHLPIEYQSEITDARWTGRAEITRDLLPKRLTQLNAFAISGVGQGRRYLSWSPLPGVEPDFHQPASFPNLTNP